MSENRTGRTRRGDGYATAGAVAQRSGSLPVYICNACGREVVWCESRKTGRRYLVTVQRGRSNQRYYIGSNLHKCEPQSTETDAKYEELRNAWLALLSGESTEADFEAARARYHS